MGNGFQLAGMYLRNENNFPNLTNVEMGKYRRRFPSAARKLLPSLTTDDMVATSKVGSRPQLISAITHKLEMDYVGERTDDSVPVLNAISSTFTSDFVFSKLIVDKAGIH